MELLYFFESIRFPALNAFMLAITKLGEETAFIIVGLVLYWCVNKRRGIYVMTVGLAGTVISQWMKIVCRIPRPWVKDPNFKILEEAREAAAGYSFPSGHTQNAVGTFGAAAATAGRKWITALFIAIAVLVGLSRMYIGVHTPADVLVGAALSIVLILGLHPLMMGKKDRTWLALIGLMVLSVAYLVFMEATPFPDDIDAHNLESAMKSAYTLLGGSVALVLIYPLEKRFVNFNEKACWKIQVVKVVLGFAAVMLVKEGLRSPLEYLFAGHLAARAVRYFLLIVVAGLLWPMTFSFFARFKFLNKKEKVQQ